MRSLECARRYGGVRSVRRNPSSGTNLFAPCRKSRSSLVAAATNFLSPPQHSFSPFACWICRALEFASCISVQVDKFGWITLNRTRPSCSCDSTDWVFPGFLLVSPFRLSASISLWDYRWWPQSSISCSLSGFYHDLAIVFSAWWLASVYLNDCARTSNSA